MFPQRYLSEFAERYSLLLGEGCPKIYVGSEEIHRVTPRDEMLTAAEAPQLCGPREFGFEKTYRIIAPERPPEHAKVRFKMTVGVLPHGTAGAQYGAHIYCNGRLLVRNSNIGLIDDDFDVREKHPASVEVWLRANVEVDGPSEAMPWTHRKDNVDNSSESFRDLRSFMATCYEKFMEESLGEARRRLRARSGARGLPTVRDLLKDSFQTKLQKKQLDRVHVRALIAQSGAFQEAAQSLSSPDEVPRAPKKQTEVTLQAAIESWKVDRMKALIRQKFGNDVVYNTDVVRVAVDHYIECVGGSDEKLEEE